MPEVVNSAPQNESRTHVNHQHSHFPIQFSSFDTHQFGYIRPHLAVKGTSSDSFKHRPIVRTRSYTLKAPLLQDVYRKLSYFKVNLHAILPMNADKVITNPVVGSDVPDGVNCSLQKGFLRIHDAVDYQLSTSISDFNGTKDSVTLTRLFKALVFGELFYSRGSLLASLGCHMFPQFGAFDSSPKITDYDDYFDAFVSAIFSAFTTSSMSVTIDGNIYGVSPSLDTSASIRSQAAITVREFLCLIRETSDWLVNTSSDSDIANITLPSYSISYSYCADAPFNFARVAAYQLACAEFFSNDKIDYIYSAELFRQYIGDLEATILRNYYGESLWPLNFTYNGVDYQYDYLSGTYFNNLLLIAAANKFTFSDAHAKALLQYFLSLFGLKRSLRYKDYFVGSRTAPLAVGDVNVNVNSNLVNVVDVSRKIQLQRFLNFVNHTGRSLSNYVKGLFGVNVGPDRHVPQYIAELTEKVYTAEVENTGSAQLTNAQTVTAVFTGNSSNKELSFGIDLESVIIGVTSYDIERAYSYSIDRDFFIMDRFDMFVPQLQFVGDQPIYRQELVSNDPSAFGTAFGYQFRDMQWKLMSSRAAGGFVGKLPGFSFMFNPSYMFGQNINPDFIRSFPCEFDNFYVALTGYSLGNYFHFITWTINDLPCDRPMISNPVILE